MSILPHHKKRKSRASRKNSKKAKRVKKTRGKRGKKGKKSRRARRQTGGSTISYQMSGAPLGAANLGMANPAPISPSDGHAFYAMPGARSSGSYI